MVMVIAAAAVVFQTKTAEAQWGFGGGGYMIFNPDDGDRVVDGINQRSLLAGQAAYASRQNIQPAANSPNSYMNHIRDRSFNGKFDISTRRLSGSEAAIAPARTAAAAPAPTPAAKPVLTLAGFFNQARQLVWPADSPVNSGLDLKRADADKASLVVLDEVNARGVATVASVTEARNLLLGYGRPALQYLRDGATTQVSDGFHRFLMGVYEALGQAAQPAPIPPAPPLPR